MANEQDIKRARQSFSRMVRFVNQLQRGQMACGPVTVQQCYTLESLAGGPKTMKDLAADVALHQSTLTRIVEKLEALGLAVRERKAGNQRSVEVAITEAGRNLYAYLEGESERMIAGLLDQVPSARRKQVIEAVELVAGLLDPDREEFRKLLQSCCCSLGQKEVS